jgi:cytochrome P450
MTQLPTHDLTRPVTRLRARGSLGLARATLTVLKASGDPLARLLAEPGAEHVSETYRSLRARGDGWRSRTGLVTVSSHAGCDAVLRNRAVGVHTPTGRFVGSDPVSTVVLGPLANSFLELDPPEHDRLRRLVTGPFRPAAIRALRPRIEAIAAQYVEALDPGQPVDLVAALAARLPIAVIADLLGIPEHRRDGFEEIGRLTGESLDGIRSLDQADRLQRGNQQLLDVLASTRAEGAAPDSLLGLLEEHLASGGLTEADVAATTGLLLVAGFETTVNLIGNAIHLLLQHPGAWLRLANEPGWAAKVVEETLRLESPVQMTLRTPLAEPCVVGGRQVLPGHPVLLLMAAANRDPEVFSRPEEFNPDREWPADHLAFSSGIHYCLGAHLARLEAEVALETLARHWPRLRASAGARRRRSVTVRGFASYPVYAGG